MSDVLTYSNEQIDAAVAEYAPVSEDIDIAIEAMHREIASLRTQLDQERQRRERAEGLLRASLKFVLDPSLVHTVSMDWVGTRDELAVHIDKHFGEWDG